jgi:hypothetical protein
LSVWAAANEDALTNPQGSRLTRQVTAVCVDSEVQLTLKSDLTGFQPEPGEVVSFTLELHNASEASYGDGIVAVAEEGFTLDEMSADDYPLLRVTGGFRVPLVPAGATLTLSGKGRAAAQLAGVVGATVWFARADGAALTERKTLSMELSPLVADVGGGCSSGAGPRTPLLGGVLLAMASLASRRSRRLSLAKGSSERQTRGSPSRGSCQRLSP